MQCNVIHPVEFIVLIVSDPLLYSYAWIFFLTPLVLAFEVVDSHLCCCHRFGHWMDPCQIRSAAIQLICLLPARRQGADAFVLFCGLS